MAVDTKEKSGQPQTAELIRGEAPGLKPDTTAEAAKPQANEAGKDQVTTTDKKDVATDPTKSTAAKDAKLIEKPGEEKSFFEKHKKWIIAGIVIVGVGLLSVLTGGIVAAAAPLAYASFVNFAVAGVSIASIAGTNLALQLTFIGFLALVVSTAIGAIVQGVYSAVEFFKGLAKKEPEAPNPAAGSIAPAADATKNPLSNLSSPEATAKSQTAPVTSEATKDVAPSKVTTEGVSPATNPSSLLAEAPQAKASEQAPAPTALTPA